MSSTVLLTLGRLPKALALARAMHAAGYRVLVAEPFRWHVCKPSRCVARSFRVPAPNSDPEAYLEALARIVREESVDLVLPVSEEALYVARLRERLPASVELLCPSAPLIEELHDKLRFVRRARALSLPVPETFPLPSAAAQSLCATSAHVLKPTRGCSGIGVAICAAGPVPQTAAPGTVAQRYVEGRHVSSLSLLVKGEALATVCYEGIVFAGTVAVCFQRVDDLPAVPEWLRVFFRELDYSGFVGLDFIIDREGTPWAIECNPRLTSGVHFLDEAQLGRSLANISARLPVQLRHDKRRFQWAYSTLTEAYAAIFRPREFARRLGALFRSRDVVWSARDPWPFLLMTPMSWEILWPAMTSRVTLGEATQRDIAVLSGAQGLPAGDDALAINPSGGESGR